MNTNYKELKLNEIICDLFSKFNRYQEVKKCWRKVNNEMVLKDIAFIEDWGIDEKKYLVECLRNTVNTGGKVFASFTNNLLVGFCSVESEFFGSKFKYLQLSSLHVSYEQRGKGMGRELFKLACDAAREMGADKLYISSHSADETQKFYKSVGAVSAAEINKKLWEKEPFDCHLEYVLKV